MLRVRDRVPQVGLRAHLRVEQMPETSDGFARICRQSNNISWDKVLLRARQDFDWILESNFRHLLWAGLEDDEIKTQLLKLEDIKLIELVTFIEMLITVRRIDRVMGDITWYGNAANSTNGYRECDGIVKQIGGHARNIEYFQLLDIDVLIKECVEKDAALVWQTAGSFISNKLGLRSFIPAPQIEDWAVREIGGDKLGEFTSNLYILPLSKEPGDDGIYEQRVDYRSGKTRPEDVYFWTDDGEFLWQPRQERWDFDITCRTEFRIVVPRPELVTVIKNAPIMYQLGN